MNDNIEYNERSQADTADRITPEVADALRAARNELARLRAETWESITIEDEPGVRILVDGADDAEIRRLDRLIAQSDAALAPQHAKALCDTCTTPVDCACRDARVCDYPDAQGTPEQTGDALEGFTAAQLPDSAEPHVPDELRRLPNELRALYDTENPQTWGMTLAAEYIERIVANASYDSKATSVPQELQRLRTALHSICAKMRALHENNPGGHVECFVVRDIADEARALASAPPESALPYVPEEKTHNGPTDPNRVYVNGWNDCRKAILSAAPSDADNDPRSRSQTLTRVVPGEVRHKLADELHDAILARDERYGCLDWGTINDIVERTLATAASDSGVPYIPEIPRLPEQWRRNPPRNAQDCAYDLDAALASAPAVPSEWKQPAWRPIDTYPTDQGVYRDGTRAWLWHETLGVVWGFMDDQPSGFRCDLYRKHHREWVRVAHGVTAARGLRYWMPRAPEMPEPPSQAAPTNPTNEREKE